MPTIIGIPRGPDAYTLSYYAALEQNGVRVIEGDFSGRWLLANRRGADFLHLNWPSFCYKDESVLASMVKFVRFVLLLALARLSGLRLLWTAHNLYPHDRSRIAALDWLGRRIVISMSHRIFVHGARVASRVAEEFPGARRKLVEVPFGNWIGFYPSDCSRAGAREQLGVGPGQFVFLFIGLCKEYKNLEYLVRCFQSTPLGDAALWITGHFQKADYYERVSAQVECQPRGIRLENRFVPDDELQHYLAACDAVVLPYSEILTSGMAMLAISFGRPVIAPRRGNLPDILGEECGVLYDPADEEGLPLAMRRALDLRFDEAAIRRHAGRFQWRDAALRTIAALS